MNTFEIVVTEEVDGLRVDHAYFVTRKEQCESWDGRGKEEELTPPR